MRYLLEIKEKIIGFCGRFDMILVPLFKFLLTFLVMTIINNNLNYMETFDNPFVSILVSLVCSLLPYGLICVIISVVLVAQVYALSLEMALLLAVFLLAVAMLYYGFQPGDSLILLLTPLLFALKIPYVMPVIAGLSAGITSIIPIGCGTILYYLLSYIVTNAGVITGDASLDITARYMAIINGMLANKTMLIVIAAFVVTVILVYLVRQLSFNYSWYIAIGTGIISLLAVLLTGETIYETSIDIGTLIPGLILTAAIAVIYTFFVFSVDYTRTEFTQFEDDDYYYYVKAVPKMSVSVADKKIQNFTQRKSNKDVSNNE